MNTFTINLQDEALTYGHVSTKMFNQMIEEIPKMIFLKEISGRSGLSVSQVMQYKFAMAVSKSTSIRKISFRRNFFCDNVQKMIDTILSRNVRLANGKEFPEKVPITQWPTLFALADPTGLNYSYECIRKTPQFFINYLLSRRDLSSSSCSNLSSNDNNNDDDESSCHTGIDNNKRTMLLLTLDEYTTATKRARK